MPKRFSNGKADWSHNTEAEFGGQAFGNFLPLLDAADLSLRQDFCFKEDFSGERTGEQFSSDILLVPIQKCRVRMERGSRDPEANSFRLFPTEGSRGTSGSGSWR